MPRHRANSSSRNAAAMQVQISFRHALAFGPGKAALLEAIAATGSITAAARRIDMPYRRAWNLVEELNMMFPSPLIDCKVGGDGGGGAMLTELGRDILGRFRDLENKALHSVEAEVEAFALLMAGVEPAARPDRGEEAAAPP